MGRCRAAVLALFTLLGLAAWAGGPAALASTAAPDPGSESAFLSHTNAERTSRGLAPLAVAADLVSVARQHAEAMASQQRLYDDPNLGQEVQGWQAVGENSGRGPSVDAIEQAFMASPPHRANILGAYSQIGVGVVWTGQTLWVAEVFRQPTAAQRTTSPPPARPAVAAPRARPTSPPVPPPAPSAPRGAAVVPASSSAATVPAAPEKTTAAGASVAASGSTRPYVTASWRAGPAAVGLAGPGWRGRTDRPPLGLVLTALILLGVNVAAGAQLWGGRPWRYARQDRGRPPL